MTVKDKSICKQVATETVAIVCDKLGIELSSKDFFNLSDKFVNWVIKKGDNKEVLIQRQAALRRSAMSIRVKGLKSSDSILDFAEELYNYF